MENITRKGGRFMNNRLKLVSTIDTKEPGKAHDEYCKKILAFKSILASIMHDQIPEYMGMPIPEIELVLSQSKEWSTSKEMENFWD